MQRLLSDSEQKLQSVVAALRSLLETKENMLAEIEAARVDEAGRGFAVAADEVRSLSLRSGETGNHIREKAIAIGSVQKVSQDVAQRDQQASAEAGRKIHRVLNDFRGTAEQLTRSSTLLQRESTGIRGEIADVLVNLQFQGRVSQILAHGGADMDRPHAHLADANTLPDPAAWLEALAETYTTAEQRGNGPCAAPATTAPGFCTKPLRSR